MTNRLMPHPVDSGEKELARDAIIEAAREVVADSIPDLRALADAVAALEEIEAEEAAYENWETAHRAAADLGYRR